MKKVLAMLLRPPVPQLAGLLLLSAVVYYGGRALRSWIGLSDNTLLLIIVGIWVLAAAVFVWRRLQDRKRARLIEDRLRGQAREHKQSVRPDKRNQVEELERQLGEALTALKTSKLGNSALYSLPWYIIIGPPGSGKTTLLRESGLTFPQQTHGRGVRGVGGTRNCDWWFTDQGILLDTAGRYTTQDEDKGEWLAFLDMLKKSRSKKPINGAIIAISIADIVTATDDQLAEHARKVRERLAELTERLEVLFPVYVMFSKCDLLDGFVDLFGGYGKQERSQVWGFTLPYLEKNAASLAERFDREFDQLHQRLCAERLKVLGTARSQAKKARIFSFPMQFAMARERLRSFLAQVDQPNPYSESSEIRGFYFTSGTQEGQPLDRVLSQMRKATGLADEAEDAEREPVDKKAYFIDELFTEVVFPDRDLAQSSAKAERRRFLLHRGGMIGTAVAALAAVVMLMMQYVQHSDEIRRAKTAFDDAVAFDPTKQADLTKEEEFHGRGGGPLERLRRMFVELHDASFSVGSDLLGEADQLYAARIRPLYVDLLKKTFVAPLEERLREQLQKIIDDPKAIDRMDRTVLNETFTLYRMLGNTRAPVDKQFLGKQLLGTKWTWTRDAERAPCPAHRDTFIDLVVGDLPDWRVQALEEVIDRAAKVIDSRDTHSDEVDKAVSSGPLKGKVSWDQILTTYPEVRLLDPAVSFDAAYREYQDLLKELEERGHELGDDQTEDLLKTGRSKAREEWKRLLSATRPLPRDNVKQAMDEVTALTKGDLYVQLYRKVCETLTDLGTETGSGETGWLTDLLKEFQGVQTAVDELTKDSEDRNRIVPLAQGGDFSKLTKVTGQLRTVRRSIGNKVPISASLNTEISTALDNLVESIEFALASEIVVEANSAWERGLGGRLAEFSTRFPFAPKATEVLDLGDFERVFGRDKEFDKALEWIKRLEDQLTVLTQSGASEQFVADRKLLRRIQLALFERDTAQREIEFRVSKGPESRGATLTLGAATIGGLQETTKSLVWHPSDAATITVLGFRTASEPVDLAVTEAGSWALLRLLTKGTAGTVDEGAVRYHVCTWSEFRKDGTVQTWGQTPATAKLSFRTLAEPDPLAPGFFDNTFAIQVFTKPVPPGGQR
ncbi:MAG: type VI secretion system membrane subunit TssM [Planctomycetes bacterium]|nr:type VI secretion system membrane subunit TssM [Planctomycetota bacterium]